MKTPTPQEIASFFQAWIPRYSFAITMADGPEWYDPHTKRLVRRNHVVCLMKNDLMAAFPDAPANLMRRVAEKTAGLIEMRMARLITQGQGTSLAVTTEYL